MRNSWGGLVVPRLPSSTRPGAVRQIRGVGVAVGKGEGTEVGVSVGIAVGGRGEAVGMGPVEGAQAESINKIVTSPAIWFPA